MPEYLAPGVYVEEIPSGNKPIAAASTSTAAMVGLAERGPINTPTLCTSLGSYRRQFGGNLNPLVFMNNQDALPYAAEGFFNNGGSRLYVTRIVGDNASESELRMVALDTSRTARPTIFAQAMAADTTLMLSSSADLGDGDALLISDGADSEMVSVDLTTTPPVQRIAIEAGLANTHVAPHALAAAAAAADTTLTLADVTGLTVGDTLLISEGATSEPVTIDAIDDVALTLTLAAPLGNPYTVAAVVRSVAAIAGTLAAAAAAADTTLTLTNVTGLTVGDTLLISEGATSELVTVDAIDDVALTLTLAAGLANGYTVAAVITRVITPVVALQTPAAIAGTLTAAAAAGDTTLTLDDATGLADDDNLLISEGTTSELVTIDSIDVTDPLAPIVTLAGPLDNAYTTAAQISSLADSGTTLTLNADAAASGARVILDASDPADVAIGDVLRMDNGTEDELVLITALPEIVTLGAAITANHASGVALLPAVAVLRVHARYPGIWGDALRATAHPAMQVQTESVGVTASTSNQITVSSAFGLFAGSVIVIGDPDTTDTDTSGVIATAEVESADTAAGVVTLTAAVGTEIADGTAVSSQEFTLLVERIEDEKAVESETFERLSMASEHPRYALKIVGSWDVATDLPSDSGGSQLIRLSDDANGVTRLLPLVRDLGQRLDGGTDDLATVDDNTYIGTAADDPDARTGIQSLENEATLSIVAVPGQTSVSVQKALLEHCEKMRYRFAVLDTPLASTLAQAREHRQNFDNTRAAIYYPGLVIADPFGESGDTRTIHPSGHMMGIYARTDVTRGVHKAPANEVVRSILGFEAALTKGEQDILNPINLNCFRDFRTENRGLRIYGGRVATSDPEWRYVNVRRLLLFIEQSLDTGLQWAVFEPNAEPLWDTVKQSVTNFLNTVWRSGALEGTQQEEAFFVRIGYDVTMTQDDIDNGRMIVVVGVAAVKPAEFVILRIGQKTREATA